MRLAVVLLSLSLGISLAQSESYSYYYDCPLWQEVEECLTIEEVEWCYWYYPDFPEF